MSTDSPIRVAILGSDPPTARLVAAIRRSHEFSLVAGFDVASTVSSTDDGVLATPTDRSAIDGEALLGGDIADLVVAAQRPHAGPAVERRSDQLKRLVQTGVPLILVHPACDMLLAYELEMHRVDGGGPIYPYDPVTDHPVLKALYAAARSDDAEWGSVEQYIVERFAPADQRQENDVLDRVACDSLIVCRLLGEISSVSATGTTIDSAQWNNLSVHFSGPSETMARWSISPQRDELGIRLSVVGTTQTVSAWIPDHGTNIELSAPLAQRVDESVEWEGADEFLRQVASTFRDDASWTGIGWNEVCRSLEVTDAVYRSVKRRRAIELYHEQVTERETFKSMMAVGGCAMLLWVLFLLLIAGVVEGLQLPLRDTAAWRLWPLLLFAPLAIFLALQLLQLAFPKRPTAGDSDGDSDGDSGEV